MLVEEEESKGQINEAKLRYEKRMERLMAFKPTPLTMPSFKYQSKNKSDNSEVKVVKAPDEELENPRSSQENDAIEKLALIKKDIFKICECCICYNLAPEPQQCAECQAVLCKGCIQKIRDSNQPRQCPMCKDRGFKFVFQRNLR